MLFCLPALKLNDGRIKINVLDHRVENSQHNIDFVHVTTTDNSNQEQTTHFGIQGRCDHSSVVPEVLKTAAVTAPAVLVAALATPTVAAPAAAIAIATGAIHVATK